MFCPKCSEAISGDGTRFCSKCGFLTNNVRRFVKADGKIGEEDLISARRRGIKPGVKLILLGIILIPAYVLLAPLFPPNDVLVESSPSTTWFEQIGSAIIFTTFLAGLARIAFAFFFETGNQASVRETEIAKQVSGNKIKDALPPAGESPAADFGKWKTTEELFEPIFAKRKTSGGLK